MLLFADKCCVYVAFLGGILLPRGCASRSVGTLVLSVWYEYYGWLRYLCVMVGDVIYGKSGQVLTFGWCGLRFVYKYL
jgi:hypothetical protein